MQLNSLILFQSFILQSVLKLSSVEALLGNNIRSARENEFPFVVSIGLPLKYYYADEKHICTGVLISRWHVLTAAHCFESASLNVVQVTIGSMDLRKGRAFSSKKWMTYDDWAKSTRYFTFTYGMNDIAVLRLTEKMDEPTIKPAKLWYGMKVGLIDQNVTVVGWGYTNESDNIPQVLRAASVRVISNKQCRERIKRIEPVRYLTWPRHLYTNAEPYVLLQRGDSGGPLIYGNDTVVGINKGTSPEVTCLDACSKDLVNECQVNLHVSIAAYKYFIQDCFDYL